MDEEQEHYRNYPRTQIEFEERFSSEETCSKFLFPIKWPTGFVCPHCQKGDYRTKSRGRFVCKACKGETTIHCGTLFSNTNKPLRWWLHALWWITGQKNGVSAFGFYKIMGLGSYRTAWAWLHKLRYAMGHTGGAKLSGTIEVDEAYIGGVRTGPGAIGGQLDKVYVNLAVEVLERKVKNRTFTVVGRIRLAVIPDRKAATLEGFVQAMVEPGSLILTDGWDGYNKLGARGYKHQAFIDSKKALPKVHRVISLLKRWLIGTHQGRISGEYLQSYLNEFVFRFNRRGSRNRGVLFGRLLELCLVERGPTYKVIMSRLEPAKYEIPKVGVSSA